MALLWVDCYDYQSNTVILAELVLRGWSCANRMKIEHNVARLWVDCFDYQSNTVIIAELVLRGRPQPVHKACHESDGLFCFKDVSNARIRKRTRNKKANETRSGSLKSFE